MLLLLLLSRFSRVRPCATPQTAAHQAPPSLGFSRQGHWSGLPFPSPMPESVKSLSRVRLFATPWTAAYSCHFPGKSTGVGCHHLLPHRWHSVKEFACQCRRHKRRRFDLWVRKIPWKRNWQPTPVFLPEKFCGQRSLVGYSSLGHRELDTTEHTHTPLEPQACQGLPYTFQMLSSS